FAADREIIAANPVADLKPDLVIKGGMIAAAVMGDPNASIPTPQPEHYRPMFGYYGKAIAPSALTFVSQAAMGQDLAGRLGLSRGLAPVKNTRGGIGKHSMVHNSLTPDISVDPETYEVTADGALLTCEPAEVLSMAQRYFLF
ncbi:MAG: urease subunit alpha, partial [Alphaproteobacteria bacterium]